MGGRKKEYTKSLPNPKNSRYHATPPNEGIRAYFPDVKRALESTETTLVDVRSPKEFAGAITAPPEYPMEHAQRGGHIPHAKNIPGFRRLKTMERLRILKS